MHHSSFTSLENSLPESHRAAEPLAKKRVLVVDDSALMRKIITQILRETPDMEVIGAARDGVEGLRMARELRPDVITLDVEMPNMDGLAFLDALMPTQPTPVVMLSSLTTEGAETTFACLQRGAVDFAAKPSGSISLNLADISAEIVAKVRGAANAKTFAPRPPAPSPDAPAARTEPSGLVRNAVAPPKPPAAWSAANRSEFGALVVIAASTGGPAALQQLLPRLSADADAAWLLVQHLPPHFTGAFASRMDRICEITVREAREGDRLERGTLLVAPGGFHLMLDAGGVARLNQEPTLWGVRPAADIAMHSAAARFGARTIGVALTGMGRDGASGIKAIQAAGGVCVAQDEATSVIYGMPRAAVETGAVHCSLPLPEIANALMRLVAARGAIQRAAQEI